jgi:hypothetical protein
MEQYFFPFIVEGSTKKVPLKSFYIKSVCLIKPKCIFEHLRKVQTKNH